MMEKEVAEPYYTADPSNIILWILDGNNPTGIEAIQSRRMAWASS